MTRVLGIDHVELFVPDRFEAAAWYERVLGLAVVPEFRVWSADPGGPLMIAAPDGTKLALFQGTPSGETGGSGFHRVAFRVTAEGFLEFLQKLSEVTLRPGSHDDPVVDHDRAYSVYFSDPWGHRLEVTTYEYREVTAALGSWRSGPAGPGSA